MATPGVQARGAAVRCERTNPLRNWEVVLGNIVRGRYRFGRISNVEGNGKPEDREEGLEKKGFGDYPSLCSVQQG